MAGSIRHPYIHTEAALLIGSVCTQPAGIDTAPLHSGAHGLRGDDHWPGVHRASAMPVGSTTGISYRYL